MLDVLKDMLVNSSQQEIVKLFYQFQQRQYQIKEFVYRQGQPCDGVFLIKSGQVQLSLSGGGTHSVRAERGERAEDAPPLGERKKRVCVLTKGQFFGHEDYFQGAAGHGGAHHQHAAAARQYTAEALTNLELEHLDRDRFEEYQREEFGILLRQNTQQQQQNRQEQMSKI